MAPRRGGFRRGCSPGDHSHHLFPRDPERIFDLHRIEGDLRRQRLGPAAEHQRGRKGPGLAGQIAHCTKPDARFLEHLAAHGGFQRLARFDESGQQRIHPLGPARRPAQQHRIAMRDQHDDHRIGARKMMRAAGRAVALPAAHRHFRRARRRWRRSRGWRAIAAAPSPWPASSASRGDSRVITPRNSAKAWSSGSAGWRCSDGSKNPPCTASAPASGAQAEISCANRATPSSSPRNTVAPPCASTGWPAGTQPARPGPSPHNRGLPRQTGSTRPGARQRRKRRRIAAQLRRPVQPRTAKGHRLRNPHPVPHPPFLHCFLPWQPASAKPRHGRATPDSRVGDKFNSKTLKSDLGRAVAMELPQAPA